MSRYMVKISEVCGMCTLGKITVKHEIMNEGQATGFEGEHEEECADCKGTGLVDERWIDAAKLLSLIEKENT